MYNKKQLEVINRKIKAIAEMKKTPMNYEKEFERHTKMQEIAKSNGK